VSRPLRGLGTALLIGALLGLAFMLLTACGPDQFTTRCNNDGGVEHVDKDKAGHPVARICTKGGRVIHKAPLPTPAPGPKWQ
jgi:hypothetical protein